MFAMWLLLLPNPHSLSLLTHPVRLQLAVKGRPRPGIGRSGTAGGSGAGSTPAKTDLA